MVIFNSYVKLPEGNHHNRPADMGIWDRTSGHQHPWRPWSVDAWPPRPGGSSDFFVETGFMFNPNAGLDILWILKILRIQALYFLRKYFGYDLGIFRGQVPSQQVLGSIGHQNVPKIPNIDIWIQKWGLETLCSLVRGSRKTCPRRVNYLQSLQWCSDHHVKMLIHALNWESHKNIPQLYWLQPFFWFFLGI